MLGRRVAGLSLSAFAIVMLGAAGPPAQTPPQPSSNNDISPSASYPNVDYRQAAAAMDAPQLFRFPGLSNKSTSVGGWGCRAGSAKNKGRPKVVATFPAEGAVVRPGVVVVRVTFDQPMACDASFDGTSDLPNPCPGRWREATLSQDGRSFRTVCQVKAGLRYRLTLRSFHNSHGMAVPADVTFSVSGAAPIGTIQQALAEDTGSGMVAGG